MDLLDAAINRINGDFKSTNIFNNTSFIYKYTNEDIDSYKNIIVGKNILSVIGSGDHILNSILNGCINIDAFDISEFTKYFCELKISAIRSLNRDEYVDFFIICSYSKNEYYDKLFDRMKKYIKDKNIYEFWNYLFNYYDWYEIYNSLLFSSQFISNNNIFKYNSYLEIKNYNRLKELINNCNINYIIGDISSINLNKTYNFINLSSIIYYVNNYKNILNKLSYFCDGSILTYIYNYDDFIIKCSNYYNDCDFIKINDINGVMLKK